MSVSLRRSLGVPGRFFFHVFQSHFAGAPFLFAQVAEAGKHPNHNIEREENRALVKNPFGTALEKVATYTEKDAYAHPAHRIGSSRPKKARAHEQPPHPKQTEDGKAAKTHLTNRERGKTMGGRGLRLVDIATRRHELARRLFQIHVWHEMPAKPGTVFIAYKIRPVIWPDTKPGVIGDGQSDANIVAAILHMFGPVFLFQAVIFETVAHGFPGLGQSAANSTEDKQDNDYPTKGQAIGDGHNSRSKEHDQNRNESGARNRKNNSDERHRNCSDAQRLDIYRKARREHRHEHGRSRAKIHGQAVGIINRSRHAVGAVDISLAQSVKPFKTNRRAQRKNKQLQFAFAPHIKRRRQENDDSPDHLGKREQTEDFRVGHSHTDTRVQEKQNHQSKAGRPEPALLLIYTGRHFEDTGSPHLPIFRSIITTCDSRGGDPPQARTDKGTRDEAYCQDVN